jgi:hypothetical protein
MYQVIVKKILSTTYKGMMHYEEYSKDSGMSTKEWGPGLWKFLFMSIMGAYPYRLDMSNKSHLEIRESYKSLLTNLQITMPCVFCRESFKQFLKELPLDNFLNGKIELMYWLYLIKDKVNKKLLEQEKKSNVFCTVPSPLFKDVLKFYSKYRAKCSKESKKCI